MPKNINFISSSSTSFSTVLKCNFTGKPKIDITWHHDSDIAGIYISQYHDSGGLIWTTGIFIVTSIRRSGYHNVSCVGKNEFGMVEETETLKCKYFFCFSAV